MIQPQPVLQTSRPVKRHVAVVLFEHRDTALQLLLALCANGEADVAVEHRRVPAGLQLRLILTREHTILTGNQARAVRGSVQLLAVGVLHISNPLTHSAKGARLSL